MLKLQFFCSYHVLSRRQNGFPTWANINGTISWARASWSSGTLKKVWFECSAALRSMGKWECTVRNTEPGNGLSVDRDLVRTSEVESRLIGFTLIRARGTLLRRYTLSIRFALRVNGSCAATARPFEKPFDKSSGSTAAVWLVNSYFLRTECR